VLNLYKDMMFLTSLSFSSLYVAKLLVLLEEEVVLVVVVAEAP
jgi:hypothetical protein